MFSHSKDPVLLRSETIATGMALMGYDAVAIGDMDLQIGFDNYKKITGQNKLGLVSANISMKEDKGGGEAVKPYILKDMGTIKVGVTSVTDAALFKSYTEKDRLYIKDAVESLKQTITEMKKNTDISIALLHVGNDAAKTYIDLRENSPDIAIVGHGRRLSDDPEKVKDTFLVQNSMTGEYLSVLKVRFDNKKKPLSCELENIKLTLELPESKNFDKLLKDYEDKRFKLAKEDAERKSREQSGDDKAKKFLNMSPDEFMKKMQEDGRAIKK